MKKIMALIMVGAVAVFAASCSNTGTTNGNTATTNTANGNTATNGSRRGEGEGGHSERGDHSNRGQQERENRK